MKAHAVERGKLLCGARRGNRRAVELGYFLHLHPDGRCGKCYEAFRATIEEGTIRHARHPLRLQRTLCGTEKEQPTPSAMVHMFAQRGRSVNCPECRCVVNYAREYGSHYLQPATELDEAREAG